MKKFVDLKTLAQNLCLDEKTALEWVERGLLPRPRTVDGKRRWKWSEVDRAMEGDNGYTLDRIYFIEVMGYIKIGFTRTLGDRLADLQAGIPCPISLLLDVQGNFDLEADLHKKFRHLRHRGEWFRKEPELMEFIERVRNEGGNIFRLIYP